MLFSCVRSDHFLGLRFAVSLIPRPFFFFYGSAALGSGSGSPVLSDYVRNMNTESFVQPDESAEIGGRSLFQAIFSRVTMMAGLWFSPISVGTTGEKSKGRVAQSQRPAMPVGAGCAAGGGGVSLVRRLASRMAR